MRRTVKDAPAPSPRRRITTPSNAWSRSFSPSMTFTDTLTVSPGTNPTRSFLSSPASTIRIASISPISSVDVVGRRPALSKAVHPLLFLGRQVRRLEQLRAPLPRAPHGHDAPPAPNPAVIAREQDRWDRPVAEHLGARVLRVLEQAPRERVVRGGGLLAERAGHESRHRLGDHEGGQLAAAEHVVADRQLLIHEMLAHALVHTLVAAAHQDQVRPARQLPRHLLA